ncbi:branched-chain amino acid ABC transporter permease [Aquicoccus sp. G2-2]|uniref:branched-chain amino acid ABC transporter permease n=1 Tax=Aquicoccus sp. G2-2 TaxID=3092120 RepID=UPI002ADF37D4|nr:branched-chain amino acid ABC transporter permease [Aquicoccus sp. G2-2]MEA1115144.1 branched-chain amino acid ABC transporter permease [Aquicoccus sp. G2-2]
MFYREAGDFKTSYVDDNQTFPIKFDRYRYYAVMFIAFAIIPFILNDYWVNAIMLPFLIYAIAAIGLNILTGYCGQVSLGSGGFMAVGAYACYKFMTGLDIWLPNGPEGEMVQYALPPINIFFSVILAGFVTALVGVLFGLPSLRIKGFYLAVATLAAQFFLVWLFNKWAWAYNYSASGQISAPERGIFGVMVTGANTKAWASYLFCLVLLTVLALGARNLTRGSMGRKWMAIRDMDIAAEIIGVDPLKAKLSAFAVSSFYIGISGALFFAVYLGAVEVGEAFGINKSFLLLFMVIIGGLGSIFGAFAGAAFLVLLPVLLKNVLVGGLGWPTDLAAHLQLLIVGALIVVFLIAEPHGIAQLWRVAKEKLRLWPFPH